jgi:hypothetical protein
MQTIPLAQADEPRTFVFDETTPAYLAAKRRARARGMDKYIGFHTCPLETVDAVFEYALARLRDDAPRVARKITAKNAMSGLDQIAMNVREDLAVFSIDEERNWLSYVHVLLPSGWDPSEKLGLDFTKVHGPVPGMHEMKYETGHAIVKRIATTGPYERGNIGLHDTAALDRHPLRSPAPPHTNRAVLRVERQTTHPLPECNASLFTILSLVSYLDEQSTDVQERVARSVATMSPQTIEYKGIDVASLR